MQKALLIFIVVLVQTAVAQDCTRIVPVTVLNVSNDPVVFPLAQLRGSVEGHSVVISRFEKIKSNRILLLLEVSASMQNSKFVKDVLEILLQQIPGGNPLAYGFFSESVHLSSGFTTSPDEINKALDQFRRVAIKGKTVLYDALDQGIKLFQQPAPGDSILVISDGGENRSTTKLKQLEKDLQESGLRLFAIVPIHGSPIQEEFGPHPLSVLAERTGGSALEMTDDDVRWNFKKSKEELISSIRRFWLETVGSGYLLTLALPINLKSPTRWKLHLDTSGDKYLKGLSVSYPEKLMPCSSAATAAAH